MHTEIGLAAMTRDTIPNNLPGHELIERGLDDLEKGVESVEALLVLIGSPRLRELGLAAPVCEARINPPEHKLYDLLVRKDPDSAYSTYNALIRRLVSFERAAECVMQPIVQK
jgi:hypothetical protein